MNSSPKFFKTERSRKKNGPKKDMNESCLWPDIENVIISGSIEGRS